MKPKRATASHSCSLPGALRESDSDTHLPPILPGTSLAARLVRRMRALLLVSTDHPETSNHYRSRTKVSAENERLVEELPPFVVHPFSALRRCWEAAIYCVLTLHLLILAFAFAFAPHLGRRELRGMQLADTGLCVLLGVEFVLTLVTGYVSEAEVILEPRRIVRYRLRWWNVANWMLLVVPYVLLLDELVRAFYRDAALPYLCLVLYLYLLCIWRFRSMHRYFRTIARSVLRLSGKRLRFVEPVLDTLYVLHWTACLLYIVPMLTVSLIGADAGTPNQGSFLVDVLWTHDQHRDELHYPIAHRSRLPADDFRAYLHQHLAAQGSAPNLPDCSAFLAAKLDDIEQRVTVPYRYLRALMITLKISLQGGHSLSVGNYFLHEWLQSLLLLLGGWIWSTYVLLLLIRTLMTSDSSHTQYDETLNEIDAFCRAGRLPPAANRKMSRYLASRYRSRYFDERPILANASDNLRRRLLTEILFQPCLERADLFRELPPYVLEDIADRLRFTLALEQDTLAAAGSAAESMYFLATGTAAVYAPDGTELGHLVDGANFGAIALFREGARRTVTVVALEVCEVYRLERADFQQLMKPYPHLQAQMVRQAERRIGDIAALPDTDQLFDRFFY